MARPRKLIPAYTKHRASGQAVVCIGGKDYYLGPHNSKASVAEYDRLIAEWAASGRAANFDKPEALPTINDLLVAYLRHAKEYFGGGVRSEYANILHAVRPLKELYGRTIAADFGPLKLKAIRQRMIDAKTLNRNTINKRIHTIVRVFEWGAAKEMLLGEVHTALTKVRGLRAGRKVRNKNAGNPTKEMGRPKTAEEDCHSAR